MGKTNISQYSFASKSKKPLSILRNDSQRNTKVFLCILIYVLMMIVYPIVAKEYAYLEIGFTCSFDWGKFILASTLFATAVFLSKKIRDDLLSFAYITVLVLLFIGEAVCYIYNTDTSPVTMLGAFLFMVFLALFQKINIKTKKYVSKKDPTTILLLISLAFFAPFLILNFDKINLKNLLLIDIYETRLAFRGNSNIILGYLSAPLSRVLLPVLVVMSIRKKKYVHVALSIIMILFLYLCGAVKSVLFGLMAVLLFYGGDFSKKTRRLLLCIVAIFSLGIILYLVFDNITIIDLIRRVFFVPAKLGSLYVDYFRGAPTLLSHSSLGLGLSANDYGSSLSMFFGENVLGTVGGNANVGIITEGYVSFGFIGVIVFSLLAAIVIHYFRVIKLDSGFAGIILLYIYIVNTSFLSVLFVTHGLLFLMIFSYFFMRKNEAEKEGKNDE